MPTKPRRPCQHPGCSALAIEGASRCILHHRVRIVSRPSAAKRGYDREWRAIRAAVLRDEPNCRSCGKPAKDVHHIQPLRLGGTHDRANLMPLCLSCHRRITAALRQAVTR